MKDILEYIMLDGKDPGDKKMFEDDAKSIDIDNMLDTGKRVCSDACFNILFEEPHEDMIVVIKLRIQLKRVDFSIHFGDAFYQKNIGKYMDAAAIMARLVRGLTKALDAVCWRSTAGGCGGCEGGHND